jgi:hypothetical protein
MLKLAARVVACVFAALWFSPAIAATDGLESWTPRPADWTGATVADGKATLTASPWSFLLAPGEHFGIAATVTVLEPAKQFGFFGSSWSAWPSAEFADQGYEAALLVRANDTSGYRVQISHK